MSWAVNAIVATKIGFASHQNAIPVIRELSISSSNERESEGLRLALVADPPFLQPKIWRIDSIGPADTLRIADRDTALNASLLHELTESLTGTLSFQLFGADDVLLAELSQPVLLL